MKTTLLLLFAAGVMHAAEVGQMLTNRPDILRAMVTNKTRLAVMAWNEFTTDGQKLVPPIRIQRAVRQN